MPRLSAQLAAVVVLAIASACTVTAEPGCWWTKSEICRLPSSHMMPQLRATLGAKIERNAICTQHSAEFGCARASPDNCEARELRSLDGTESAVICVDNAAAFESLENYRATVEASPAFQELCFTPNGYVSWACMRDLSLLSKAYGCTDCADDVRTLEKKHQVCTAAKDRPTCEQALAAATAAGKLPTGAVPRDDNQAAKTVRVMAVGVVYGTYPPPPMTMSFPPPPLNTIEVGASTPPKSAASPVAVGLSMVGAVVVGMLMLAF